MDVEALYTYIPHRDRKRYKVILDNATAHPTTKLFYFVLPHNYIRFGNNLHLHDIRGHNRLQFTPKHYFCHGQAQKPAAMSAITAAAAGKMGGRGMEKGTGCQIRGEGKKEAALTEKGD